MNLYINLLASLVLLLAASGAGAQPRHGVHRIENTNPDNAGSLYPRHR